VRQPADRGATDTLEVPHDDDAAAVKIGHDAIDKSVEYTSRTMKRPVMDIRDRVEPIGVCVGGMHQPGPTSCVDDSHVCVAWQVGSGAYR
jgi:hypothetical protein